MANLLAPTLFKNNDTTKLCIAADGCLYTATCIKANDTICANTCLQGFRVGSTQYICAGTFVQSPIVCATNYFAGNLIAGTGSTCTHGAITITGSKDGYGGIFSCGWTWMTNVGAGGVSGIYDSTGSQWGMYTRRSCETRLFYNGGDRFYTTTYGTCSAGYLCATDCLKSPIVCAVTCVKTANLCLNASGGSTLECALVFDATANGNMSSTFRMGTSWDGTVNTIFLGDSNSRTLNISDQDRVGIGHTSPLGLLHLRHTNNNCVPALITSHNGATSGSYGTESMWNRKWLLHVTTAGDVTQNDANSKIIRLQLPASYADANGTSGTIKISYFQGHAGGVMSFEYKFSQYYAGGTTTYSTWDFGTFKVQKTGQLYKEYSYLTTAKADYIKNNLKFYRHAPASGTFDGQSNGLVIKIPNSGTSRLVDISVEVEATGRSGSESFIKFQDLGTWTANAPSGLTELTPTVFWLGDNTDTTICTSSTVCSTNCITTSKLRATGITGTSDPVLCIGNGSGSHSGPAIRICSANSGNTICTTGTGGSGCFYVTSSYNANPIVCTTGCFQAPTVCATTFVCAANICSTAEVYLTNWVRSAGTAGIYWSASNLLHLYPQDAHNLLLRSNCSNVSLVLSTCNNTTPRGYFYGSCDNHVGILDYNGNWRVQVVGTSTIWLKNPTCICGGGGTLEVQTCVKSPIVCATSCLQLGGTKLFQQGSTRLGVCGTGDNYAYFGPNNDDSWTYIVSINNSAGMYFHTNQGNFLFDGPGHLGSYDDGEVDVGFSGKRFRCGHFSSNICGNCFYGLGMCSSQCVQTPIVCATSKVRVGNVDFSNPWDTRLKLCGSGDNYMILGPANDNGWGYIESVNNSSGIYFGTNQGNFMFDTGSLGSYTDGESDLGFGSNRFRHLTITGTAIGAVVCATSYARVNGCMLFDQNYGHGAYGLYSSTKYQHVWGMGTAYKQCADGTGLGNLYGLAYTHTNVGGESKAGLSHQLLFVHNGSTHSAVGSGMWTCGVSCSTNCFKAPTVCATGSMHTPIIHATTRVCSPIVCSTSYVDIAGTHRQRLIANSTSSLTVQNSNAVSNGGLVLQGCAGQHGMQLYWSGGTYGFLDGAWAGWDIKKTANGSLEAWVGSAGFICACEGGLSAATCVTAPVVCGSTCVKAPIVCGTTCVCAPTIVANDFYSNSWFRNQNSGTGLYNQATGQHFYSDCSAYWNLGGGSGAQGLRFRHTHNSTIRGTVYATIDNDFGFLDGDDNWSYRHRKDSMHEWKINDTAYLYLSGACLCSANLICANAQVKSAIICSTGSMKASDYCALGGGWFRSMNSASGNYNQCRDAHFYAASDNYWHINPKQNQTTGALIFYQQYNSAGGSATGRRGYVYFDGTNNFGLLDCGGNWRVKMVGTSCIELNNLTCVTTCVKSPRFCATSGVNSNVYCSNGYMFSNLDYNSSSNRGPWNPSVSSIRGSGRRIYYDEDFHDGNNSISVYNNSGGTAVTITRVDMSAEGTNCEAPNSSGQALRICWDGGSASPNRGGVIQTISSSRNKTFAQIFQACLPSGSQIHINENSQGTNNRSYWITTSLGTGKWEWYGRISHAGNSGTFSSGGHLSVSGPSSAFKWYIGSMTVYDVTDASSTCEDVIKAACCICTPISCASEWSLAPSFCGTSCFKGDVWKNTSNNLLWCASGQVFCAPTRIESAIVCATATSGYALRTAGCIYANNSIVSAGNLYGVLTCGTTCVETPVVCATKGGWHHSTGRMCF